MGGGGIQLAAQISGKLYRTDRVIYFYAGSVTEVAPCCPQYASHGRVDYSSGFTGVSVDRVKGQEGPKLHLCQNMGANWDYLNACVGAEGTSWTGCCLSLWSDSQVLTRGATNFQGDRVSGKGKGFTRGFSPLGLWVCV